MLSDAVSLQPVLRLPRRSGWVLSLAFDSSGDRLAVAGHDADVELWDLGLLRSGLAAAGLAWDRPAPAVAPNSVLGPPAEAAVGVAPLIAAESGPAAAAAYRIALQTKADDPGTRVKLAETLRRQGQLDAAVAELARGPPARARPCPCPLPSRRHIERARQGDRPAPRGDPGRAQIGQVRTAISPAPLMAWGRPDEAMAVGREAYRAEAWTLLELASLYHSSKRYAAEAGLFAEAYAANPELRDDWVSNGLYTAACAAALAGLGQGDDNPRPDAMPAPGSGASRSIGSGPLSSSAPRSPRRAGPTTSGPLAPA